MNIVIMGAGAIGSFFGAMLSKKNNVALIGRKSHVDAINKMGLTVQGKTKMCVKIPSFFSVKNVDFIPDLLILAVKSYDTEYAIKSVKPIIGDNTVVMSLQNGLDNIEKIEKIVNRNKITVCITTHGVVFSKPGVVTHTGIGRTAIGCLNNKKTPIINNVVKNFNANGIKTTISNDINKEIWVKAIINSSINPVTSLFQCKNGYLIKNPVLEKIVEKICAESTNIANTKNLNLSISDVINKTKQVIKETSENKSSMFQSVLHNKKTEIDSINGILVKIGNKQSLDTSLNGTLTHSIKNLDG